MSHYEFIFTFQLKSKIFRFIDTWINHFPINNFINHNNNHKHNFYVKRFSLVKFLYLYGKTRIHPHFIHKFFPTNQMVPVKTIIFPFSCHATTCIFHIFVKIRNNPIQRGKFVWDRKFPTKFSLFRIGGSVSRIKKWFRIIYLNLRTGCKS